MRPRARILRSALAALVASVGVAGCSDDAPTSRCDGPVLHVAATMEAARAVGADAPAVARGSLVYVFGERFTDRCEPGGNPRAPRPLSGVRILIGQGERLVSVSRVDAAPDGTIVVNGFGIPPNIGPGSALVTAQLSPAPGAAPLATASLTIT